MIGQFIEILQPSNKGNYNLLLVYLKVILVRFVDIFFCAWSFTYDSAISYYWGTDLGVGVRLLSEETLLQVKKSTGRRWDLNPGSYG